MVVEVKSMEAKKKQQPALNTSKNKETVTANKKIQVADFISEIKAELKRINWTNPEELKTYTLIVVGATFFCGMGIYFMDLLIQACLWFLESALRLVV
ncbi:preprotein translocase subunit SecE [Neochlamydia sp. S13]|uniref:preprotein translocase subunit SecE n=1 Tax=Neochlamydia sp. S13 TaxID=1353976 RepID=UPI000693E692|nr:preprotein translocase subunit SecE [Neochlamydia sp. S13]BBI16612.1 Protein translocase subunit SecE [Neochlamydia sp. S13]